MAAASGRRQARGEPVGNGGSPDQWEGAVRSPVLWAAPLSMGGRGIDGCLRIASVCRRDQLSRRYRSADYGAFRAKGRPNNLQPMGGDGNRHLVVECSTEDWETPPAPYE